MPSKLERWVVDPPPADVRQALERLCREEDVHRVAVMPDVHLSKEVCVGIALATRRTLIPAAVGGDIGCGMAAVAFDTTADALANARDAAAVLDGLVRSIPIMRHRRSAAGPLPAELDDQPLSCEELDTRKSGDAALQFGTLGRGNHFLEFQADEDDRLWLMVHSGSRGMGQAIRELHEQRGAKNRAGLRALDASSAEAEAYLSDVRWALSYAERSRWRMATVAGQVVRDVLGVDMDARTKVECHHNFVRRETHGGRELWVHRKGAISARLDEPGIIPGSMGSTSFHVVGRGHSAALCSSSHGAGRCMSRTEARKSISPDRLHRSMKGVWFDHRRARRLLDEAPEAYKDIGAVMKAQRALTRPTRRLRPVLSFKGG